MHAPCTLCRRAFCRQHIVSLGGRCFACADRCSRGLCDLLATKECQRCHRKLCVTHRTTPKQRCPRCESDYNKRLDARVAQRKADEGSEALIAVCQVVALVALSAVLGEVHILFLPLGIAATWALGRHIDAPREPVRVRERERFLTERPTGCRSADEAS
jgi:hypothetical protein